VPSAPYRFGDRESVAAAEQTAPTAR
jgi:hypothetical protein